MPSPPDAPESFQRRYDWSDLTFMYDHDRVWTRERELPPELPYSWYPNDIRQGKHQWTRQPETWPMVLKWGWRYTGVDHLSKCAVSDLVEQPMTRLIIYVCLCIINHCSRLVYLPFSSPRAQKSTWTARKPSTGQELMKYRRMHLIKLVHCCLSRAIRSSVSSDTVVHISWFTSVYCGWNAIIAHYHRNWKSRPRLDILVHQKIVPGPRVSSTTYHFARVSRSFLVWTLLWGKRELDHLSHSLSCNESAA